MPETPEKPTGTPRARAGARAASFAALALSVMVLLAGCAGQTTDRPQSGVSGGAETPGGSSSRPGAGDLSLSVRGSPGVRFSGSCVAGGEERGLGGRVPKRFTYRAEGVECELRKLGEGGVLRVVLEGSGGRSVQQTNAGGGTIRLSFGGAGSRSSVVRQSSSSVIQRQSSGSSSD